MVVGSDTQECGTRNAAGMWNAATEAMFQGLVLCLTPILMILMQTILIL